jgi:AraC family transcriptional regulator
MRSDLLYISGSAGEAFGCVLRTRIAGEFLLRESRYAAGPMPVHYHPRAYFSFVVRGTLVERDARAEHHYGPGSLHAHAPGAPHSGAFERGGGVCMSIVPRGALQQRLADADPAGGALDPAWSRLAACCHRALAAGEGASDLAIESFAVELVAAASRTRPVDERHPPRWVQRVRDRLHECGDHRVALTELAALADVHPVHLVRAFRRHVGTTPADYQRRLRIERARRALLESDVPLVELSLDAGFSSQAHFTRWFHGLIGVTPAAYRRAHRRAAR